VYWLSGKTLATTAITVAIATTAAVAVTIAVMEAAVESLQCSELVGLKLVM
jgi:hypothetical protein